MLESNDAKVRALLTFIFENYVPAGLQVVTPLLRAVGGGGVPAHILADPSWALILRLNLDPEVYDRMRVELREDRLCCLLSFDRLYECEIPYSTIMVVGCGFEAVPVVEDEPAPKKPGFAPRLVTDDDEDEV